MIMGNRKSNNKRILVVGCCGSVGRPLVRALLRAGLEVVGVDGRPWPGEKPEGFDLHATHLHKRPFEEIFRRYRPSRVVHAGLVTNPHMSMESRYEHNVVSMQRIVSFCGRYGAHRFVLLSRGSVYGADLHNPVRVTEDAPLRGAIRHKAMRDIVEADILAQSLTIREPSLSIAIIRPSNVVAENVRTTMVGYLRLLPVPTLMGYDPMFQIIHLEDLVQAMGLAIESDEPGVFNVSGPGEAPLSVVIQESGGTRLPIMTPFFTRFVERLWNRGVSTAPIPHADYLRYPLLLDCNRIADTLGFVPAYTMRQTLATIRRARPEKSFMENLSSRVFD